MNPTAWIAFAALLSSTLGGFMIVLVRLGRVMQRIDLLWDWYLENVGPPIPGGRRKYDPPALASADEDAGAGAGA